MSIDELIRKGLLTHSPGEGGTSGDAGSGEDNGKGDDAEKEKESESENADPKVDKEKAKKDASKKALEKRDWKRKTTDKIGALEEQISGISNSFAELKNTVERAIKEDASGGSEEAGKNGEGTKAEGAAIDYNQISAILDQKVQSIVAPLQKQISDLTSSIQTVSLETQRREVLAELGVREDFLSAYKEGLVSLPDKVWEDSELLADTLTKLNAYPEDDATDTKSGEEKSGSGAKRTSVARRDSTLDTGAIQADGGSGADARALVDQTVKEIEKDFEAMKDKGGIHTEGLTKIFSKLDKTAEKIGESTPF